MLQSHGHITYRHIGLRQSRGSLPDGSNITLATGMQHKYPPFHKLSAGLPRAVTVGFQSLSLGRRLPLLLESLRSARPSQPDMGVHGDAIVISIGSQASSQPGNADVDQTMIARAPQARQSWRGDRPSSPRGTMEFLGMRMNNLKKSCANAMQGLNAK